jgi:hypothetical protein
VIASDNINSRSIKVKPIQVDNATIQYIYIEIIYLK